MAFVDPWHMMRPFRPPTRDDGIRHGRHAPYAAFPTRHHVAARSMATTPTASTTARARQNAAMEYHPARGSEGTGTLRKTTSEHFSRHEPGRQRTSCLSATRRREQTGLFPTHPTSGGRFEPSLGESLCKKLAGEGRAANERGDTVAYSL